MLATLKKELLLLMRDPGGLLLLLIMPAALIIVMALVQDAPYRDYQEMKFEILVVNQDKGFVGKKMETNLQSSPNFRVVSEYQNKPLTIKDIHTLLADGKYKFGIIIPADATASLVNASNKIANKIAESAGLPAGLPVNKSADSALIDLLFDPAVKPAFRSSLAYALNEFALKVKMEILMERLSKLSGQETSADPHFSFGNQNLLSVREKSLSDNRLYLKSMNSVQHNVPAWAIFGMFLIVVPISGNMIRERDEGSALRIRLIPGAGMQAGLGKIVFNMLVCMLQFFVMIAVGVFLLPVFGLPRLFMGSHPEALLLMALAISAAAVGYGYFIGSIFKTANQAMPFGAISVVLFSAMGGVWVPVEILPGAMQQVALFSPLHWGLEGVKQVMLRGAGVSGILLPLAILFGFALATALIPAYLTKR
jgi:ABC-2 type transport system permease protein